MPLSEEQSQVNIPSDSTWPHGSLTRGNILNTGRQDLEQQGERATGYLDSFLKSIIDYNIVLVSDVYQIDSVIYMVFPIVMYGCESWTRKKAECQRIDGFELWCWRRLLRVPWTARRSNQSILKEIVGRTDAKAETPILWPPDVKNWLIGKDPDAEKDWRQEEKGTTEDEMVRRHHWLNGHEFV